MTSIPSLPPSRRLLNLTAVRIALAATLLFPIVHAGAAPAPSTSVAVAPQYDTTHVYVPPEAVDAFVRSFVATFGGRSTPQVVATVTPTPSSTSSQLVQTPAGAVSVFGFRTPVPFPFGSERYGYLVRDLDQAVRAARAAGADVLVAPFPDPIGRDAIVQWPGGVNMQLYWHTKTPNYPALQSVPEHRAYVSPDRAAAFVRGFVRFSGGKVVSDTARAPGIEIGRPGGSYRRVRIESAFGRMAVLVTDCHLPYPYGRETTGYAVGDLAQTLSRAEASGATVLVKPVVSDGAASAIVQFPGGHVAEIHGPAAKP